jgi:hypothetical protein
MFSHAATRSIDPDKHHQKFMIQEDSDPFTRVGEE